jgi:hypothetical protein
LQHRSDLRCCAQVIESQWRTAGAPSRGVHLLLAELDAVSANTALPETERPYVNTATVTQRLDLSARRVRQLCAEGRFDGAHKVGIDWVMPAAAIQAEAA